VRESCHARVRTSLNMDHSKSYPPIEAKESALDDFNIMYKESIDNPNKFWDAQALSSLDWFTPYKSVVQGSLVQGDQNWFNGGQLNTCYNCVDRHSEKSPDKVAMIWESDEPGSGGMTSCRCRCNIIHHVVVQVVK